jgi:heme oxygenase
LGVALSDNGVWANGLLVFSKVFFQLEKCLDKYPSLSDLKIDSLVRTKAFEEDLDFYFGPSWRTKPDSDALTKYLAHLERIIEEDDPLLLVAYVYHLYMGLLSGGQILAKKKSLFGGATADGDQGNAVTTFQGGETAGSLKKQLRSALNDLGPELDTNLQERIIQEGVNVFKLNNTIIETVEGVDEIFYKRLFKIVAVFMAILAILAYIFVF